MSYPTYGDIKAPQSIYVVDGLSNIVNSYIEWKISYVGSEGTLYYKVYFDDNNNYVIGNMSGSLLFEFDNGESETVNVARAIPEQTSWPYSELLLCSGTISIPSSATKLYLKQSTLTYTGTFRIDKTKNVSGEFEYNECYIDLPYGYSRVGIHNTYGGTDGETTAYTHTFNPYNASLDETKFIQSLKYQWFAKLNDSSMTYNIDASIDYTKVDGFEHGTVSVKLVLLDAKGNELYLDKELTQKAVLSANSSASIPYNGYLPNGIAKQIVGFRMEMSINNPSEYYKTICFFKFKEEEYLGMFKVNSATIGTSQKLLYDCSSVVKEYDVQYQFGNLTGYAIQNGTAGHSTSAWQTVTWSVPNIFYDEMPNSKIKSCTYTIIFKRNGVILGSNSTTADIYINESVCAPVINPIIKDINDETINVTSDIYTLVKYVSNARVDTGITLFRGATIKSVIVINGSQKMEQAIGTFTKVTDKDFHITVTDSRGVTSNKTITVPFVEYIMPTCDIKASRPNVDGELKFNISGYCYNGTFGEHGLQNSFRVAYRYKPTGGEFCDYVTVYTPLSGNSYSIDITLTGLEYKKTYIIEALVADSLFSVDSAPVSSKGEPIFDWDNSSMNINVPLTITESIHVPDGGFYVQDTPINFSSLVSVETGTWEPSMVNAIIYNKSANYIKIGNLCILNWNIQARGESSGGQIKIYGLPFTLNGSTFQSGGGTISGVSIPSGHSFSGWELSSDGNIYAKTMVSGGSGDAGYATMVESQTYNLYASGTLMYVVS